MSGNEPEFSGKRAVITGGTQGLGFEVAKRLATQGAELFLS
jgi:NAD(P)-dependent dehydrogenase (short-subunit alcohol dehydrogenase family)